MLMGTPPMKKSSKKEKSVPFRLPESWLLTLQELKDATGITKQQFLEDATAFYFGKTDPLIKARREVALDAFDKGKVERPFNQGRSLVDLAGVATC
jgi:predicted acylesterase/phospholipase RssA